MKIREELTFGIDLGIASCGWAVIRGGDGAGEIVALGTWMFDAPETAKERTPTNQLRRTARGLRRVVKRRRQRMNAVRKLMATHSLIAGEAKGALWIKAEGALLDPWTLRAEGLDRRLSGPELAVTLGHIAKHRGFKSNRKGDHGANAADDSSKMLKAIEATQEKSSRWRTVGEMFARDEAFASRKRNRDGDYTRSILRDDQAREVAVLFQEQRRRGNALASPELEAAFAETAFFQRPLQDSEDRVGPCPFEPGERRAARRSYSFELFRMLSRLAALRLQVGREEQPLKPEEIATAAADFGRRPAKVSYKELRKRLGLDPSIRFAGVAVDAEGQDFVSRQGAASTGTTALREAIGESAWRSLLATPDKLDRIAFTLTFREDLESIRTGLEAIGLEPLILGALMDGVRGGKFSDFKGAAHISAKAARAMIPHLMRGLVYSDAAAAAGYDHSKRPETDLASIGNPVARKSLGEALKQIKAMKEEWGLPGRIHVELARDVGKSQEERDEIRYGIEKRNKAKERLRAQFEEEVGRPCGGAEDLLRFELWKEQNGRCLYTDAAIHPNMIVSGDRTLEVDHILPWSRFGDDSFINKTLCFASANQDKRGRTPFEWLGANEEAWRSYSARVEAIKVMKGRKKRNYTLKGAAEVEDKFRSRNLNDTRYATRLLADQLKRMYPDDGTRRVFARPGALTDRLRRGWGIQDLKKDEAGARRSDDRHHALDALICAAMSESALQKLTKAFQESEAKGSRRDFEALEPPWPGFVEEARAHIQRAFVARAERRRARGEAHAATVRAVGDVDGQPVVYEKKKVDAGFKREHLASIKNPERNREVITAIENWIDRGRPADAPPMKKFGGLSEPERYEPIRKVTLQSFTRPAVLIRRGDPGARSGSADRSRIIRVDIFENGAAKSRSKYLFVPIYAHQVVNETAPDRVFTLKTDYSEWPSLGGDDRFLFSVNPFCFLEADWKERGAFKATDVEGYFRNLDVNDGRIMLSNHTSRDSKAKHLQVRLSPTRILALRKVQVGRLGVAKRADGTRVYVERETRTWRGAVCT